MLKHDYNLQAIYKQDIPIQMLTDYEKLFDIITKSSLIAERRLMIDFAAAREDFNRQEISQIGLIRVNAIVADALTKKPGDSTLDEIIVQGVDETLYIQWIMRGNLART